jgi:hypothetical protein
MKNDLILKETSIQEEVKLGDNMQNILLGKVAKPKYLKLVFSLERPDRIPMIQVEYDKSSMDKSSIVKTNYYPNLINNLQGDAKAERSLFYSLISMFSINDSRIISTFFKKLDVEYQTNKEVMNRDKVNIFEKYKSYLILTKDDEELKEDIPNPLRPVDETEKSAVSELLTKPMYKNSDFISLVRQENQFFWNLQLTNIQGLFENESNRLHKLKIKTIDGSIDVKTGEYILFDGVHELPKMVIIRASNGRLYKLSFIHFRNFTNKTKRFYSIVEDYNNAFEKRKKLIGLSPDAKTVQDSDEVDIISEMFLL